jgi:choline kinase
MADAAPIPTILAAGLGRRLGGQPKTLFELGGRPLLDRCAERLRESGFDGMVVMTGHCAADVEAHWRARPRDLDAEFVHNPRYADLNNFYTVEMACRSCPAGPLLVLNSDIVLAAGVLDVALAASADLVLTVQPGPIDEEGLGVRIGDDDRPLELGKHLDANEFIGVSLLSPAGREAYAEASAAARAEGATNLYYEDIYSRMCSSIDARVAYVEAGSWAEIDAPEDLPAARAVLDG